MVEYSEEEINNYPIVKELDKYFDSEDLCSEIGEESLINLDSLIKEKRIELTFLPKEDLEDNHSIVFEIAMDDYYGGATECFLNVTSELFNKMIERYSN